MTDWVAPASCACETTRAPTQAIRKGAGGDGVSAEHVQPDRVGARSRWRRASRPPARLHGEERGQPLGGPRRSWAPLLPQRDPIARSAQGCHVVSNVGVPTAALRRAHHHQRQAQAPFGAGRAGTTSVATSAPLVALSCLGGALIQDRIPPTILRTAGTSIAGATGLEPATSGVTGRRSNQLSYAP
jgi:hypothetical protein